MVTSNAKYAKRNGFLNLIATILSTAAKILCKSADLKKSPDSVALGAVAVDTTEQVIAISVSLLQALECEKDYSSLIPKDGYTKQLMTCKKEAVRIETIKALLASDKDATLFLAELELAIKNYFEYCIAQIPRCAQ
jgi:hypothetical protein